MSGNSQREIFALSQCQRNIWDLESAYAGLPINHISTTIRIQGRLDFVLLQKALETVIAADPTLRLRITKIEDEPMQYTVPFQREEFSVYDFSGAGEDGIAAWESAMAREALPVLEAPLYRFAMFRSGEHSGGVFVKIHHIISDGWSQALICNRVAELYFALLSGKKAELPEIPGYQLYVADEREYLKSPRCVRDREYWQSRLAEFSEASALKDLRGAAVSPVGRRCSFRLPDHLNHAIYSFCIENRVAPFSVFYMALAVCFRRFSGSNRFTIGVPIFNRSSFLFKQCTGMFVCTLPFINEIDDAWSCSEFNEHLNDTWREMLRHQRFPYREISAMSGAADGRLFQIALSYQDNKIYENHDTSVAFSGRWHYSGYQAEQLCIHLSNLESPRKYTVDYDYLTQFFTEEEITALHNSMMNLLTAALASTDKPLSHISMLSVEERERVLYTFNRTSKYIDSRSIADAFAEVAEDYPSRVALIHRGERVTYRALSDRAGDYAAAVRAALPEERGVAAVLLPREPELFAAMMGVLRAGWAYLLIAGDVPELRAKDILERSGAKLLISDRAHAALAADCGIPMLCPESLPAAAEAAMPAEIEPEDLAYVVYTSGSTGKPKGVEITNRSLRNLAQAMEPIYGKGAVLSLCSIGFDAFVLESAAALLNGRTIVLPTPQELEDPAQLADLISGYAVGFLATTPSRLQAQLRSEKFSQAMRGMESIVCGGEAFPRELLQTLSRCSSARIYNQYGPSEATVAVSHKLLNGTTALTVGTPLQNCRLYVLDAWRNPLPVGAFGELYIGGVCVGRGYRNAPELTEGAFISSPFESGERLYRTGDMACWTEDGEIMIAGRQDRQIKLRGLRVEPQEIASCIASHPQVEEAVARVMPFAGQTIIAVYYTAEREISEVELRSFAASYLPHYMIPSYLCRVERIPLTANGKVDENSLPMPELTAGDPAAPADSITTILCGIFAEQLQKNITPDSDYFLFGGNSLLAMQTLAEAEQRTGCRLNTSDLYVFRTPRRLAACIRERSGLMEDVAVPAAAEERIEKAPRQERYPLSPVQRGIYFQSCLDETGLLYNMPGALCFSEALELPRLERAFCRLIAEEELLRTRFVQEQDGIFARVEETAEFHLEQLTGATLEEAGQRFVCPFDLSAAPLLHAGVWTTPEGNTAVLLDMHHIIADGMTTPLLLKRLAAYYEECAADVPEISYKDYAYYLETSGGASEEDRRYWKQHLTPMPAPLLLPTDYPRTKDFDFKGAEHIAQFSPELSAKIDEFCRERGLSAYSLILAAVGRLFAAVSGRTEFTVGTPVTDRVRPELREVCGPFINVLPMKLCTDPAQTVGDYLNAVRDEVSAAMDHSRCTPEEIISLLELPRSLSGSPLYEIIVSMKPFSTDALDFGGKKFSILPLPTGAAKAELGLDIACENGSYAIRVEYARERFAEATIALYGRSIPAITEALISGDAATLGEVDTLSAADRIACFDIPDHTYRPYVNLPVHEAARNTALLHPEDTAVIFHGEHTSRIALERRACRIANTLRTAGAEPGGRIGICMRRTPDFFAGMLAILKTGCAYVPLLAEFPEKRLAYMAETAEMRCILCDAETAAALPESLRGLAVLPSEEVPEQFRTVPNAPGDLINVLFTSGSTGQPKGVMVRHSSAANLLANMTEALQGVTGPMICTTTPVFDIFLTESLLPLAMGRTIVLADEEEMLLPWKLAELIEKYEAGFIQFTASRMTMCLSNEAFRAAAHHLQFSIVGGEQVSPALVSSFKRCCSGRLVNLYGPTEATVYITMADLTDGETVTIGRPMPNCRVYVLDEQGNRLMPTAQGELYLAGEGVAAGYLGRPDLTEAAFRPDPFVPGGMMYRSGDLGRLRADGSFDCCGRRDSQIKINGQRLEIDEIVNRMLTFEAVEQAVVLPVTTAAGSTELHAVCVRSDGGVDSGDLAAYLREYLPDYMIPAEFHILKKMPYTVGGKADMALLKAWLRGEQNLPADVLAAAESAAPVRKEAPAAPVPDPEPAPAAPAAPLPTDAAGILLAVWKEVLGRDLVSDRSFFEQGGTSLDVLNVLSRYYNRGYTMSIQDFYQHPTAAAQAELLQLSVPEIPVSSVPVTEAPAAAAKLPRSTPKAQSSVSAVSKTAFLTGATGFFGAHLLHALLERGTEQVICLVRGKPDRLWGTLVWYFGSSWLAEHRGRIRTVSGDLTAPRMGMTEDQYLQTAAEIDAVFHTAADVRHYSADEDAFLRNNVAGTRAALALAVRAGAVLHHMSSLSISGDYLTDAPETPVTFTETDFDLGQNWQENLYVRSKMLAEAEVYAAMREQGLRAKVYRLGRLVGRASDGVFQREPDNNLAYLMAQGFLKLGAVPDELADAPLDVTPVDCAADAVAALQRADGTVFHLMNPAPPTLWQSLIVTQPNLRRVSRREFGELLLRASAEDPSDKCLALLGDFVRRAQDEPMMIRTDCTRTLRALDALGCSGALPTWDELCARGTPRQFFAEP